MNLRIIADFKNMWGLLSLAMYPRPNVVNINRMKPTIIVFFYPRKDLI